MRWDDSLLSRKHLRASTKIFYLQNLGMDQIRLTSVVMHLHEWLLLEGGRWRILGEWGGIL